MSSDKSLSRRRASQDTCESMPRSIPKKIGQQTIKHTYEGLTSIPSSPIPHCIRHLYISHNNISNLQGIESFVNLESLNISYNRITRVQELRRCRNPCLLKHLKMRMNCLPYGYQDYAVAIFPELRTFEDIKLTKESKEHHHIMRQFVSQNLIDFIRKIESLNETLDNMRSSFKENDMNRFNREEKTNWEDQRKMQLVNNLVGNLQKLYVYPDQKTLASMSITNLLTLSAEILKVVCESPVTRVPSKQTYLQTNRDIFEKLTQTILVKFAARNDKLLIDHIHSFQASHPGLNLIEAFARLGIFEEDHSPEIQAKMAGGAIKNPLLTEEPGKYMQKIDQNILKEHPINKMANWKSPPYNTLLEPILTKWHGFYQKPTQALQQPIYEQIPLFIYCKQYLQVITEIVLDKTSELLLLDNRQKRTSEQGNKNKLNQPQVEDEIELELSMSDAVSFGKEGNEELKEIHQFESQIQKQHPTVSKFRSKVQENQRINIKKYSLYEINLAFKVFRSLKKRVKRRLSKMLKDS